MPTSVFGGTFYNDSSENLAPVSPGFVPSNSTQYSGDDADRRPSIASATTVSSTGSKSSVSGKFHKKLQGFFGDEYNNMQEASRQGSETSSMQGSLPAFAPGGSSSGSRNRNNSVNDGMQQSGQPSPTSSRPRTPAQQQPPQSSEVTPWMYQDTQVRCS